IATRTASASGTGTRASSPLRPATTAPVAAARVVQRTVTSQSSPTGSVAGGREDESPGPAGTVDESVAFIRTIALKNNGCEELQQKRDNPTDWGVLFGGKLLTVQTRQMECGESSSRSLCNERQPRFDIQFFE